MSGILKKKMIDAGRDDFVNYLAELIGKSRQTASEKLKGNTSFTSEELAVLTVKLGLTDEELKNIVTKD